MTEENLVDFIYYLFWLVIVPAILIGFVISVIWPGARLTVSDILYRGWGMFILLFAAYSLVEYIRAKWKK